MSVRPRAKGAARYSPVASFPLALGAPPLLFFLPPDICSSIYFCSTQSASNFSESSAGTAYSARADAELTSESVARGGDEAAEVERSEEWISKRVFAIARLRCSCPNAEMPSQCVVRRLSRQVTICSGTEPMYRRPPARCSCPEAKRPRRSSSWFLRPMWV
jgi:hypothetical protein